MENEKVVTVILCSTHAHNTAKHTVNVKTST